ncbi:MAG: hypothetical protein M9907_15355 [Burkholderiaceae bacterium]|nr:hypothetical protein [Burkholderiaceae bacterium]
MKGLLLALDGIHSVFQWVVFIVAVGLLGYLWWIGELVWWIALLDLLLVWIATAVVGILYRLGTYPMRTELIRGNVVQAWKDGILTEEQRADAMKRWRSGMYWHLLFGIDPFNA